MLGLADELLQQGVKVYDIVSEMSSLSAPIFFSSPFLGLIAS